MIYGIGIDTVEIKRFHVWAQKPTWLARIFEPEEIAYCFKTNHTRAVERIAGRFAVREAAYKAFSPLFTQTPAFLTWCRHITVIHHARGYPVLHVDTNWLQPYLSIELAQIATHLSITYTDHQASAMVVISAIK